MSAAELLIIVGISLAAFASLCGMWVAGHRAADRAAERALTERARAERRKAAARRARMLSVPEWPTDSRDHPGTSGNIRETPFADPDPTREVRIPPYMHRDTNHKRQHRRYQP